MDVIADPDSDTDVIIHLSASLLSPRFPRHLFTDSVSHVGDEFQTTLALVIEPLILGVLPRTAIPALMWIILFGLGGASVVPYILRYLDAISTSGETEGSGLEKRKSN